MFTNIQGTGITGTEIAYRISGGAVTTTVIGDGGTFDIILAQQGSRLRDSERFELGALDLSATRPWQITTIIGRAPTGFITTIYNSGEPIGQVTAVDGRFELTGLTLFGSLELTSVASSAALSTSLSVAVSVEATHQDTGSGDSQVALPATGAPIAVTVMVALFALFGGSVMVAIRRRALLGPLERSDHDP